MNKWILAVGIVIIIAACNKKDEVIGKWDDIIKLSTKNVEFGWRADSVVITTEGDWWWINAITFNDSTYQYYGNDLIDLESDKYLIEEEHFVVARRDKNTLFVKFDDNLSGDSRLMTIIMEAGNYFDYINIQQEPNPEPIEECRFKIDFFDGNTVTESDLLFYDSSTCHYFFNKVVPLDHTTSGFSILVDTDTILKGGMHSCVRSDPPMVPYYISDCFFMGKDILQIGHYGTSVDLRNDSRIINIFEDQSLLLNGLSVVIDSVRIIKTEENTDVLCTFTVTNNDDIAYLIPDADLMGDVYFSHYVSGLSFKENNSGLRSSIQNQGNVRFRDDITLSDLSVIEANSQRSFTFKSINYHPIPAGDYRVSFGFMGIVYTAENFELSQPNGRIYVGEVYNRLNSFIVE